MRILHHLTSPALTDKQYALLETMRYRYIFPTVLSARLLVSLGLGELCCAPHHGYRTMLFTTDLHCAPAVILHAGTLKYSEKHKTHGTASIFYCDSKASSSFLHPVPSPFLSQPLPLPTSTYTIR